MIYFKNKFFFFDIVCLLPIFDKFQASLIVCYQTNFACWKLMPFLRLLVDIFPEIELSEKAIVVYTWRGDVV